MKVPSGLISFMRKSVKRREEKMKTKLHITLEFDDIEGFDKAVESIRKKFLKGMPEKFFDLDSNYKLRADQEIEKKEAVPCKIDIQTIDGKQMPVMILQSKMNSE